MNPVYLWIIIAVIVLVLYGLYRLVKVGTDLFFSEKESNPIKEIDKHLKKKTLDKFQSISERYEDMMDNPIHYTQTEQDSIMVEYELLLCGKIVDEDTLNAPKEMNGIHINTDYVTYLKNQSKKLGPTSWHAAEYKRIKHELAKEKIIINFRIGLLNMGAPTYSIPDLASTERMESLSPQQWKDLVDVVKKYDSLYEPAYIMSFLEQISNLNTLMDPSKMELYNTLMEKEVPEKVAKTFLEADLDTDELEEILSLIDQGLEYDQAISTVLIQKKEELEKEEQRLRIKNRRNV